jgi:predicted enzyme related to lactoylglutathione lyase
VDKAVVGRAATPHGRQQSVRFVAKGEPFVNSIVHWEIPSTDLAKSQAFYEALFGWEFEGFSPDYLMFEVDDGVGGALQQVDTMQGPGIEVYIDVEDIEAALARVRELGGTVADPKTEIGGGMGYWAAFLDPCGCRLCLWSKV